MGRVNASIWGGVEEVSLAGFANQIGGVGAKIHMMDEETKGETKRETPSGAQGNPQGNLGARNQPRVRTSESVANVFAGGFRAVGIVVTYAARKVRPVRVAPMYEDNPEFGFGGFKSQDSKRGVFGRVKDGLGGWLEEAEERNRAGGRVVKDGRSERNRMSKAGRNPW